MNENVVQPTKQKVNEGHLWDDMKTSATEFAAKVGMVLFLYLEYSIYSFCSLVQYMYICLVYLEYMCG